MGLIFSLTAAIPIANSFEPNFTSEIIIVDSIAIAYLCRLLKSSKQAQSQLGFLTKPAVIFGILAMSAAGLPDWYYISEKFISYRFMLGFDQLSIFLVPANIAGLIGYALFGILSLKAGLRRTTAVALVAWLLTQLILITFSIQSPIWIIVGGIAVITSIEAIVFGGLQTSATEMVAKNSLGIYGSIMTGMNTIADSIGGSLTSSIVTHGFKQAFTHYITPLPLSDEKTALFVNLMGDGNISKKLILERGIPLSIFNQYTQDGNPARMASLIKAIHVLGYFCIAVAALTCVLYLASIVTKQKPSNTNILAS